MLTDIRDFCSVWLKDFGRDDSALLNRRFGNYERVRIFPALQKLLLLDELLKVFNRKYLRYESTLVCGGHMKY